MLTSNILKKPNQNLVSPHKARQTRRPNKKIKPRKPIIKQEKKRKEEYIRENKTRRKIEIVASLKLELLLLRLRIP